MSEEGHNSGVTKADRDKLKAFVERVERLVEERQTFSDDIKDVLTEAKGAGYDVKALRKILKIRKADKAKLDEEQAILETYCHALGMESYLL